MDKRRRIALLVVTLVIMIASIILIIYFGPENIIKMLGIENTYLFIFFFAILDGVSFLSSASFFGILALLSSNLPAIPVIIVSSLGLTIGDIFYYLIGKNIKELGKDTKYDEKVVKVRSWFSKFPNRLKFIFIYLYTAISPFPKDVLCLALGITEYPILKVVVPMFLGNATFVAILIYVVTLFS